jgi:general secretion pathway protein A
MYNAFFGLTKNPFGMAPDPNFFFLTGNHREAVASLTYAITERKGFLVLSGPVGAGKTTVLNWVLSRLSGAKIQTSVIHNPLLNANEFLEAVMLGFDLKDIPDSRPRRFIRLRDHLRETAEKGWPAALIIDEAHALSPELLEEIRLIGNYEHNGEKLLQILLIGQSEIDALLNRPDLRQLKQRICVRAAIEPLSRAELDRYILHRWKKAGGGDPPFPADVVNRLFYWSGGIPRLVNSLADNALLLAFAENQKVLNVENIDSVARDLQLTSPVESAVGAPRTVSAPAAPPPIVPANTTPPKPIDLKTLERYEKPAKPAPFFIRWAGKLGLA